jgi:predicted acetyltransferase
MLKARHGIDIEVRAMREADRDRFRSMTAQSFSLPARRAEVHASTQLDEAWVICNNGNMLGGLRGELVGQFFGGKSVASAAVSAVQVLPEARGKGYGNLLMTGAMSQWRDKGAAISILYPTNVGFYRSLGYEFGGSHTQYRLPILAVPRPDGADPVESFEDADLLAVKDCYRRFAEQSCGLLDRSDRWWSARVPGNGECAELATYRYCVRKGSKIDGYIIYSQQPERSSFDYSYSLVCHDLIWHNSEAAHSLLAFAGGHVVVGVNLMWIGAPGDPLTQFVHLQQPEVTHSSWWMARLLDVPRALSARGYPGALDVSIALNVKDEVIIENSGAIRIDVKNGSATSTKIGHAKASIDVGTLSSIYTGWLPAKEAVRAGRLQGASQGEVQTLGLLFGGSQPWCLDRF